MIGEKKDMYKIETSKDVRRLISSILQLIVIIAVLILIIRQLFTFVVYKPYDPADKTVVSGEACLNPIVSILVSSTFPSRIRSVFSS